MSARHHTLLLVTMAAATGAGIVAAAPAPPPPTAWIDEAGPLPFYYDLYTFRGHGEGTTVLAAFAVEARELNTEVANDRTRYRFSVTLVLADTAARSVSNTHDTVYVDVGRRLPPDHLLFTQVELPAPPSTTTQQRVLLIDATTPGNGQLYNESVVIPDYSGKHLMLSDIALGQPDAQTGWRRGDVTLALLPTSHFPDRPFDVYYEIYNLPTGTPYRTEIAVEYVHAEAADRRPVRLLFNGESSAGRDGTVAELRRVDASLADGRYRITVTITNLETGSSASRARAFDVRGWERGATMVAALPHPDRRRANER